MARKKATAKKAVRKSPSTALASTERFVVYGVVTGTDKVPAANLRVVAFDQDETGRNLLGVTLTDQEGTYRIEYGAADFRLSKNEKGGADIVIRVYGSQANLLFSSAIVRSAPAEVRIDATLPAVQYVVHGRIPGGQKGLLVRAYDVDLRSEELLGYDFTGTDGSFEIPYSSKKLERDEVGSADLRVDVRLKDGGTQSSGIFYNADADKLVNLEIKAVSPPAPSEFELNLAALTPTLGKLTLVDIDAGAAEQKSRDLAFLAGDTGIDAQHVAWLVQAAGESDRSGTIRIATHAVLDNSSIAAAVFYGWLRQGLPGELDALLSYPNAKLISALKDAIEGSIIPRALESSFDALASRLDQLRALHALQPAAGETRSSLGDVLNTLPDSDALSASERQAFARLHAAHGPGDDLWTQAEAAGLSKAIPVLKRTLVLDDFTAGNPPLMHALQARADAARPESVEFLVGLQSNEWIDLVFQHGVPPASGMDRDGYIDRLQADVEKRFPTPVLSRRLERGVASKSFPTAKLVELLDANPGLDFRSQHIEPFLGERGIVDEELRAGALRLARIHSLTQSADETGELLSAGLGSAGQIVSEGKAGLAQKLFNRLPAERVEGIFNAAEHVVSTVVALGTAYGPTRTGTAVSVLPTRSVVAGSDVLDKYPSLRTLFGDLDYCECRHCRSVLGPAAYLTDLLHFLQRSPLTPSPELAPANYDNPDPAAEVLINGAAMAVGGTVLGALLQRRPDLVDLELSCENTDTEIPYIDLVLEILENAVGLPLWIDPADYAGVDIETEFSNGKVAQVIVDALLRTDVTVGKNVSVRQTSSLAPGSAIVFNNWIIKDGSRRWFVQHVESQFVGSILGVGSFQVLDATAAMAALIQGQLDPELEDKLSMGLPIAGEPEIKQVAQTTSILKLWTVRYTRGIAIKANAERRRSSIERFTLKGDSLGPPIEWPPETIDKVLAGFTAGKTGKINAKVAKRLGIPADQQYLQTWNPRQQWWELTVTNLALLARAEVLSITALTYQNSALDIDLTSVPENRNPTAYNKLSAASTVFPWALPFDLWLEETRAFLDALGVSRAALIDLARPQAKLTEDAAALELSGLSKSEADLILSATTAAQPWIYWGLDEKNNTVMDHTAGVQWHDDWQPILARLSMLLQQSGLSYREYLDIRATGFIGSNIGALVPPDECKTSSIALMGLDAAQFTAHLNRVHVFTRLWRRSGWTMRDLDAALMAFGGSVTAILFQDLALLKRLRAALDLPLATILGCIDRLGRKAWVDHTREGTPTMPSIYDGVFQRSALRALPDFESFAVDRVDVAATTVTISVHADFIAASLGIKPADLLSWLGGTPSVGVADFATLDNLSRLYAAAALCRTLDIKPATLPAILALLGEAANPFRALPAPTTAAEGVEQVRGRGRALLEFVERARFVAGSGFDLDTLSYLLQHRFLPTASGDPAAQVEQTLSLTLTELRAALQGGVVLGDASAENLRRQLARLGWYPALVDAVMGSEGLGHPPGAEVEIAPPLAADPAIPLNLISRFKYQEIDATTAVLKCSGALDHADFVGVANLFDAATLSTLETRYNDALAAHVQLLASAMRGFELPQFEETLSNLTVLPVIPAEFKDRLDFELTSATDGTLTLTGWLSAAERDALLDANPTNPTAAAITSLYAQALNYTPAAATPTFIDVTAAEGLLREPDIATRHRDVLLALVARLEVDLVLSQLSAALGIAPAVIDDLLEVVTINGRSGKDTLTAADFLSSYSRRAVTRSDWGDQFRAIELLGKIATVGKTLAILPEQWALALDSEFATLNVLTLPVASGMPAASFESWRQLVNLFRLRDVLDGGPARLTRVDTALKSAALDTVRQEFADAFELDIAEADGAVSGDLLEFQNTAAQRDYNDPDRLLDLAQLLHVIQALGTTATSLVALIAVAPGESTAALSRSLFAASIDGSALAERLRPVSNRLRDLQRNALVAYLVHRDHLADSNELFDRYLIDVEMGSCMLTSRVKQAISSVQLFVQRCLLNLERSLRPAEPGVSPASIDALRWQWMKFYRVWEANRKVFLYPENWIEPELRDDKTEIFQAFESELLQSEITDDSARAAFRKYLDMMTDISDLTVVSMVQAQTDDGRTEVHLVGRENCQPYKHYYRQWTLRPGADFGSWNAWEEISAQVDSEHVLIFLFGGSVYLAWPSISAGQVGNLKWKIHMSLAKRTTAGWTKLKKGRGDIECPMLPYQDERTSLAFRILYPPAAAAATVAIAAYGPPEQDPGQKPNDTEGPTIQVDNSDAGIIKKNNFDTRNPFLRLNLKALASYSYAYAGSLKQAFYKTTTDLLITVRVTADVGQRKRGDPFGGYNLVKNKVYSIPGLNATVGIQYSGPMDGFIPLDMITPNHWDAGKANWVDDPDERETLIEVTKIEVEVSASHPANYKTSPVIRKFSVSKLDSFTWQEDFIFELLNDPSWLPSGNVPLVGCGCFTLKDDDSLELYTNSINPPALDAHAGTGNYMSGYREGTGNDVLTLGNAGDPPSLNTTPGQYFITKAEPAGPATREIWSYRDDQFSLLFWRNIGDAKFRMVPFSVGGLPALKSSVARDRLLDAVALPGSLLPKPIDVGTGIDFLRDPNTGDDELGSESVTQVRIDFDKVPSSVYNWELFFHNPLLVATRLSQAQRFEEAQRWFHLIFDPTTDEPAPTPSTPQGEAARYWRLLPLREAGQGQAIEALLEDLAKGVTALKDNIDEWADRPFRPHLVARHRLRSYQFAVVLKYVQNLVDWGDQIFRRDTLESINEATQLYVLAAKILGKRPIPSPGHESTALSYRDIQSQLDYFSNAWVSLEPLLITQTFAGLQVSNYQRGPSTDQLHSLRGLYFCVPGNEKLDAYWDMVADRLFKIRHCMNIDGVQRQLPLFEPPIDPALLVKATAAGLDIGAVLSDLEGPLPRYRFNVMLLKATEVCGEVRALGSALLGALEKKDAEELALLRSSHEMQMLKLVRSIKEQQRDEARTNLEALRKTRENTVQRYLNYQRLMGKRNVEVPAEGSPATFGTSTLQLAPPSAGDSDTEGLALTAAESGHMGWLNDANTLSLISGSHSVLAGILHAIPDTQSGSSLPMAFQIKYGGSHLGSAVGAMGAAWNMAATNASFQANRNATIGGHQRRFDEWQFQSNLAAKEIEQIDKQILASDIRRQIAERDISNHDQQIENAQEADEFIRDKYTNQQLYSWTVGQISGVYFRAWQLAHSLAKRAETSYRFELGLKDSSFIDFGYWDSLKKGLMAGERLSLDLKRMEAAYLDQNRREFEITKHVSLLRLDPVALITLRQTRQCEFTVPEALFDLDFAGHYLRRIKNVSLTVPCVTGPYSGVPCTLTLLKSSIRNSSTSRAEYARDIENDDTRFTDVFGSIQSIVTSSGQNDSGLFETNLRDERYLPFEGAGAISTWRIELPNSFPPFDYDTIADVILHVRYTARGDGGLKTAAEAALQTALNAVKTAASDPGTSRLFSLRQEFPTEWNRLTQGTAVGDASQEFVLTKDRFPLLFGNERITISKVELYAAPKAAAKLTAFPDLTLTSPQGEAPIGTSTQLGQLQRVSTGSLAVTVDTAIAKAKWTLSIPQAAVAAFRQNVGDVLMVCTYSVG